MGVGNLLFPFFLTTKAAPMIVRPPALLPLGRCINGIFITLSTLTPSLRAFLITFITIGGACVGVVGMGRVVQ